MSDTTTVSTTSGWTLYDVFLQGTNIYNGTTSLVAISGATWTACAIARSEIGTTGIYGPPTITNLPAGIYTREVRRQIGGSAAQTDPLLYVDTAFDPAVSGTTTPAAAIAAALSATANLNIYAPATGSTLDLYRADAYQNSEGSGRSITITKSANETHWPTTLTSVKFTCKPTADTLEDVPAAASLTDIACTVIQATGSQSFRLELTAAQSDDLTAGTGAYEFWFRANTATNTATLRSGRMTVRPDPTA